MFESQQQAERIIGLILRRMNTISSMFGENSSKFEPLLYEREATNGEQLWFADDWCAGFLRAMELSAEAWDPLVDDETNRVILASILMLGTQEGLDEIDAAPNSESQYAQAVKMLHMSMDLIHIYWHLPIEERNAARAWQKPGRNDPVHAAADASIKNAAPSLPEAWSIKEFSCATA